MSGRMTIGTAKCLATLIALVPAAVIVTTLSGSHSPAEPVEYLQDETGMWALRLLLVCLALSPLHQITRWRYAIPIRRPLGVVTFCYATVHAASFLVFDQLLDIAAIAAETFERPFILLGMLSWLLLAPMALSSNNLAVRRLGVRRWKLIHKTLYLVITLVCLHFFMLVKVDLTSPLAYSAIAIALLIWRLIGRPPRST